MGTGRNCSGSWRTAAMTSTAATAATATATAAISRARGGPSLLLSDGDATWATLGVRPVGDRAGQRACDARDLLHAGHDAVGEVVHRVGRDPHDDVIWAGHVLGRKHTGQLGQLLG